MDSIYQTGDKVLFPYEGELIFGWILEHANNSNDVYVGYLSNTKHVSVKEIDIVPSLETLARRDNIPMPLNQNGYSELYTEDGYGIKWRKFVYYVDEGFAVMSGHYEKALNSVVQIYGDEKGTVSVPPSRVFLPSEPQG